VLRACVRVVADAILATWPAPGSLSRLDRRPVLVDEQAQKRLVNPSGGPFSISDNADELGKT
jgi:hypothetical protein